VLAVGSLALFAIGEVGAPEVAAATNTNAIHYGYALVDSTGELYGTWLPCPPGPGVMAEPLIAALKPPIVVRSVGASFYLDPNEAGADVVANTDGSVNNVSPVAGVPLAAPIVGVATAPTGLGYWLAGADGGVFAVNGAAFFGSMAAAHLNAPIVGIAGDPGGHGYWLVAADGGVFALGGTVFAGSLGTTPLRRPVVGIAATPTGRGYWVASADGSVYPFGDAVFYGSRDQQPLNKPVVGIAATNDGLGYWLAAADGGVFAFGDAQMTMSLADRPPLSPIVGVALWPQQCPA